MKFKSLALVSVLFSASALSYEVDLGVAADYNIFVQNDFTHTGWADSQGKIAVGGNASLDNYDVAVNFSSTEGRDGVQFWQGETGYADVLVVQGDLSTNRNSNQIKGNLVLGGDLYKQGSLVNDIDALPSWENPVNGEVFSYEHNPINFDTAFAALNKLSEDLANMANTGNLVAEGNEHWTSTSGFIFTPDQALVDEAGAFIATIDGETLKNAADFKSVNLDANTPIIINVSGKNVSFDSVNYYDNLAQSYAGPYDTSRTDKKSPSSILYNFYEAESIEFSGGFMGHILAPKADFSYLGGDLSGQLIAKSMTSNAQMNLWQGLYDEPTIGGTPVVSEPQTIAFFLLLAGYLVINRKKLVATPKVTLAAA
ncbi:choice-of-anchor A family protein [Catenovulum agarivorans]|uniref:choice-of-anchor A family protein n=1 Tax=Catenovulum agarivorans TaxID=1172192 RepID=UPI0002E7596E|nr:choice-of-anchor A family protein [Catenovulum agarivorans]